VTRPAPQRLPDDEPLCDVLTVKELLEEVTENLLQGVPELTGGQILNIRQRIAQIAHSHGWVES
jgi:hypothetical protein